MSRFDDALTDVGMGLLTTTMDYDNLNKQTPTILARKPFAVLSFEKRKHPSRTVNRFVISFT